MRLILDGIEGSKSIFLLNSVEKAEQSENVYGLCEASVMSQTNSYIF